MSQKHTDDELLAAYRELQSFGAVARRLGRDRRGVARRLKALLAQQARQGWSPEHDMTHTVPDGFTVKGVSTLYGEDGTPKAQWVKSAQDGERQAEILREAIQAMAEDIPREAPIPAPAGTLAELVNLFVITDYHFGALAWGEETGEDWDLGIAEDLLLNWFAAAIQAAPSAHTAVFAELGDYMHFDGLEAVTPTNRHILDADTRFSKLVRVVIRVTRRVIRLLLEKHSHVHVIPAEGNHNLASSAWMREWLAALYEDEPRVTVDTSPDPYYCYEHGQTSLFFHHGHLRKFDGIQDVFVAKFREVFGRTRYSYAHMGHMHHKLAKETPLMIVEQHQTLAAKDAHASRGGYASERSAQVITYHRDYGEVGRVRLTPEMVHSAA